MTSADTKKPLAPPLALELSADPDLDRLCSAWTKLPKHIKAAISVLVQTIP